MIEDETSGTTRLYHTDRDPLELENLAEREPGRVEQLRAMRREYLDTNRHSPRAATEIPLDAATLEHLKSVGYAGD